SSVLVSVGSWDCFVVRLKLVLTDKDSLDFVDNTTVLNRCRESWLAVKDSLTHHPPGSQGWAPSVLLSCHVVCICVCVFCVDILGFVYNYIM
ncbi:hypothetical protein GBAR_LOCUS18572, partial [Geodia barretti]